MTARRAIAGAVAALALLLAGCGGGSSDIALTTADTSRPDRVAAAFAAAFAGGDTPLACTYAGGNAKARMSAGGDSSLCSRSAWSGQGYWLDHQCVTPAYGNNPAVYTFIYRTNGQVGGGDSFVADVTGADRAWQVTSYVAGPTSQTGQLCAIVESVYPSPTAASS